MSHPSPHSRRFTSNLKRVKVLYLVMITALALGTAFLTDQRLHLIPPVHSATLCVNPGGTSGCFASIQAAITAASPGDIINVAPGTYTENIILNKSVTLNGAQAGVDARGRVVGAPNPAVESIITAGSGTLIQLQTGAAGAIINGFSFQGGNRAIESAGGPINQLRILNNHVAGFTGNGIFLNDTGLDITVNQNVIDGTSKTGSGGLFHLDTDNFDGFRFTNNVIRTGPTATGFFVDGNHNVGVSTTRSPLIGGNFITDIQTGMNLGSRAFEFGTISGNTFQNSGFDGLQGGIQNTLITGNVFHNNGRSGLALTSFGNMGADRGGQNCTITCNTFTNNGFTQNSGDTAGGGITFSATQAVGTIATNHTNNNNISGNFAGARYTGVELIDVENNWWGNATGPTVAGNPGGTGDRIAGSGAANLDFAPFQTTVLADTDGDGLLDACEPLCTPAPANLVSWLPGDGNASDIEDGNNGTVQNGAGFAAGFVGQAFRLDGVDDFVNVPDAANLDFSPTGPMTVDMWVFRTAANPVMYLLGKQTACGSINYQLGQDATRGLYFAGDTGSGVNTNASLPLDTWTHLAATYDGTTWRFYINGTEAANTNAGGTLGPANAASLEIGASGTCGNTFPGLIDEVEIFNRALSASEIQAIYNASTGGKCKVPELVAAGATIVTEGCNPGNGAIDPGETVTVSLCVQNIGSSNTSALMGTLQATGGVTDIQSPNPQLYGVVIAGGSAVCAEFSFTATGTCGDMLTASLQCQDGATDLGTLTYDFTLGTPGPTCCITPCTTCPSLYVADTSNNRVQMFDGTAWSIIGVGSVGSGNGQFRLPEAVTFDVNNRIYVADTGNNRIQWSTDGGMTWANFATIGSGPNQVRAPQGLVIDAGGNLYVSDTGNGRVLRFDGGLPGNAVIIASNGTASGQVGSPRGLAVDATFRLFVTDESNSRILRINNANTVVVSTSGVIIATVGSASNKVRNPQGVALDEDGTLYVADTGNSRILRWINANPNNSTTLALTGSGLGQVNHPEGITVSEFTTGPFAGGPFLVVGDTSNNRIQGRFLPTGGWMLVGAPNGIGAGVGQFRSPSKIR